MHEGSLVAPENEGDAGNGAAMRNLPAVLATLGDLRAFERLSLAQAHMTHHHRLSDAGTLGPGSPAARPAVRRRPRPAVRTHRPLDQRTNRCSATAPYRGRATAFVVDTVQTVLHFVSEHEDFEDAVVATVNQGDDADTTGALAGMLAGARCGASRLPWRWLSRLQPDTVRAITDQTSGLLALADQLAEVAHG